MDQQLKIHTQECVAMFLEHFGMDLSHPHLKETPRRVTDMYQELLEGYGEPPRLTVFPVEGTPQLVNVCNISFYSLCSHHLIPFFGKAHVAYLPSKKLVGLSKIARVVKHFSAKLQIQENLTEEICTYLEEALEPDAIAVMMTAEHLCMSMRGIKAPGHQTTTSAMRGKFITDTGLKEEFLKIIELSTR